MHRMMQKNDSKLIIVSKATTTTNNDINGVRQNMNQVNLILVHNTAIEMLNDHKHKPRYLSPFEVFKCTNGGNYKLRELDGAILQYKYAAFCILSYIT